MSGESGDNIGVDLKAPSAFPEGVVASPTLGKLFEALAKAQAEIEVAKFDSANPFFAKKTGGKLENNFASMKSIDEATKKALTKNNLGVSQIVFTSASGTPSLLTVLGHSSGEFIGGEISLLLDKQNMQGLGSAVTYGKRYSKSALIGVVSDKDDDGNAAVGKVAEETDDGADGGSTSHTQGKTPPPKTGKIDWKDKRATEAQIELIKKKAARLGWSDNDILNTMTARFKIDGFEMLTQGDASVLIEELTGAH